MKGYPGWVWDLYCFGLGDLYWSMDLNINLTRSKRLLYKVRGFILTKLFNWWWYKNDN